MYFGFAGGSLPLEGLGGVGGLGVLSFSGGTFEENFFDGTSLVKAAQQDVLISAAYAMPFSFPFDFGHVVQVGVSGKWLSSTLLEEYSARALVMDAGISCRFEGGRWGLHASGQNMGSGMKYVSFEDPTSTVWRVGGYGLFDLYGIMQMENYLVMASEVKFTPAGEWVWGVGVEYRWPAVLEVRAGYASQGSVPSVGLGIPWGGIQLDYGLIFSFQPIHLVSLGFRFGDVPEWEPPIDMVKVGNISRPTIGEKELDRLRLEIDRMKVEFEKLKTEFRSDSKGVTFEKRLKVLEENYRALRKNLETTRQPDKPSKTVPEAYTVEREGESLKDIAKRFYGEESMWEAIYELNKGNIPDPNHLSEGQVIFLPERNP